MRYIRKIAGITVLLVMGFMTVALFQDQAGGDTALMTNQIGYHWNESWQMSASGGGGQAEVDLPFSGRLPAGETVVFQNTLPEEYAGLTMNFTCENAEVRVLLDGREIYRQASGEAGVDGEHCVGMPNTVPEGDARGEVCLELTVLDGNRDTVLESIVMEANGAVVIGLSGSNLADIACCLLILVTAVIMLVLAMLRWYTRQPGRGEAWLGLFGLTAGIYCFIGTDTFSLFFQMGEVFVAQEYLMLLLPLFLALYYERNLRDTCPRRFSGILWVVTGNAVIQILLERMGIWNLVFMSDVSAAILGILCVMAVTGLQRREERGSRCRTLLPVLSGIALLTGEAGRVILHLCSLYALARAAELRAMTLFGLLLAFLHILQISGEYRADAEEKAKEAERQNKLLEQAKREALLANEAKGKFLAQMSHEIRTPINAVLGMDEMILREAKEENIREYAMDIYTAGQTLLSLINDILDFSKIDSGKMEIVPVTYDFSSLIHDLMNMICRRAEDKGLRLEAEVSPEIPSRLYGDDVRIRQILVNLLTNAVKYTPRGTVWLRVGCRTAGETALLRFEVEDTGIGIKEEDLPKLSAEFTRIEEDRNRHIEGTGLGMSITNRLLALLGSRLHVESEYGKGSRFSFELEQKIMDPAPVGDFHANIRQLAERYRFESKLYAPDARILVVDDNEVNRRVLRNLLKETGIRVTEAAGGGECLRLVQENRYDLIFLDHMMPDMDGVETLHRIRALADFPCKDVPVVALTANAVSGAKEAYLAEGFDAFLSKPVIPDKLEAMLRDMLPEELLRAEREPAAMQPGQTSGSEACPEDLPLVEGLDWHYAWLHLPDRELLAYTVKEFYGQIDPAADCLERAYEGLADEACLERAYEGLADEDCLERYRIQVHAMKSLAATVGILSLSGVARVLESAAKGGKIDIVLSLTPVFLEEWRGYREKLKGVFDIGAGQGKQVTEPSVIMALVEMVRVSMREMDFDRADELVRQLREYDYPADMGEGILKLAEAVNNLDPEESDRLATLFLERTAGWKKAL